MRVCRSTGKPRRKTKQVRKRLTPREGSPHEEEYLLNALHEILPSDKFFGKRNTHSQQSLLYVHSRSYENYHDTNLTEVSGMCILAHFIFADSMAELLKGLVFFGQFARAKQLQASFAQLLGVFLAVFSTSSFI